MPRHAPDIPNLSQLAAMYPLQESTVQAITAARDKVAAILTGRQPGIIAIVGPCAMTVDRTTLNAEGNQLQQLAWEHDGLVVLHRMPPWKPRTNPGDWHGLETELETVVSAYRTIAQRASMAANVAIELGYAAHLERYGSRLTFGWTGSRHVMHDDLMQAVIGGDPTLPIGVKNAMDGTIDSAIDAIERINAAQPERAPAILIYRGGANAQDAEAWQRQYRQALERTSGRLIVDTAHGGEMAFDPYRAYGKSVRGQIACMEAVLRIADVSGEAPLGIMMEASDAVSPTDPVMPFTVALDGVNHLYRIRSDSTPTTSLMTA